jgi:hypothetical protein
VEVPTRAPCSVDEMIAALEQAKRAGASGLATGWTVQHDPQTPGIQTLVVTEDETSVEIAGG